MKKLWMPLYLGDFLSETMHLGATETGIYIRLIMHCWQHGSIPLDDRKLALIAHCDGRLWQKYKSTILGFFCYSDQDVSAQHSRVTAELLRCAEISNKRKGAALQKHSKSSANAVQLHTQSQSQLQSKKEDISTKPSASTNRIHSKAYPEDFERFWSLYPDRKNNSKAEALKGWEGLSTEDRLAALAALPAFTDYCRRNPDYRVVHCVRFLTQRRFDSWKEKPAIMSEFRV